MFRRFMRLILAHRCIVGNTESVQRKKYLTLYERQPRLSCVYRAKTSEPRIWLSGTLVFKRKFIGVKHQNLEAVLEGVS